MSRCLGLSVGESFAELVGPDLPSIRWFLPRRNLGDGLKEFLEPVLADGGTLTVLTSLGANAFQRKIGSFPAVLVTSGFEQWPILSATSTSSLSRRRPVRGEIPVKEDFVFGIGERIRADGTIEVPVSMEELGFLVSKLELLKTRTIALTLLHADKNPAHEILIRDFFKERGFTVFCSHSFAGNGRKRDEADWPVQSEIIRWSQAHHLAYAWPALAEQKNQIETALGAYRDAWHLNYFTDVQTTCEGLSAWATRRQRDTNSSVILHLGLEKWMIVDGLHSGVPKPCVRQRMTRVQPTSALAPSAWSVPLPSENGRGFEPGPMAFGKSLQPTVFDVFFTLERLELNEPFPSLLNEKTKPRIQEALFTLAKELPGLRHGDSYRLALDIETSIVERIHQDLLIALAGDSTLGGSEAAAAAAPVAATVTATVASTLSATLAGAAAGSSTSAKPPAGQAGRPGKEILLTGALARTLHPRLEARRPDLRFRLVDDGAWAEAWAAIEVWAATLTRGDE